MVLRLAGLGRLGAAGAPVVWRCEGGCGAASVMDRSAAVDELAGLRPGTGASEELYECSTPSSVMFRWLPVQCVEQQSVDVLQSCGRGGDEEAGRGLP